MAVGSQGAATSGVTSLTEIDLTYPATAIGAPSRRPADDASELDPATRLLLPGEAAAVERLRETIVLPVTVLDFAGREPGADIKCKELIAAAGGDVPAGSAVLVRTGWGRHRGSALYRECPGLDF